MDLRRPFVCLSRGEMQANLRAEKKDLAEERRRWDIVPLINVTVVVVVAVDVVYCLGVVRCVIPGAEPSGRRTKNSSLLWTRSRGQSVSCTFNVLRMIESQKFVMTNLRNGIDYLKNTCKDVGQL
jgi:hypothetical protein